MKKLKKLLTMALAAAMTVSAMSISIFAEEDDAVYTLIGENGNEIVYTQADIDEGHWDVDALGKESPYLYESFPMKVDKFVNDFSELQLELRYLKSLDENSTATVTVIDLDNEESVYTSQNLDGVFYSNELEINKTYALTLSETFDGETSEYSKIITTYYEEAEMPGYITSAVYDSDCTVLVGDVEDLRNSEKVDENGEEYIDTNQKRYVKVAANDFISYRSSLDNNAVYRIYTKDENENRYTGFISTYSNSNTPSIYMPSMDVLSVEEFYAPAALSDANLTITAAMVQSAPKTDISMYRDHCVSVRSSTAQYKVYSFTVPDVDPDDDWFRWQMHFDNQATVEMWLYDSDTNTLTKSSPVHTGVKNVDNISCMRTFGTACNYGDTVYLVIYFPNVSWGTGTICIEPDDTFPSDAVSGSAYVAYNNSNSLTEMDPAQQFTLYDRRDVDCFYINYKSTTSQRYRVKLLNNVETNDNRKTSKVLEIAYYKNQTDYFYTGTNPDDITTVPIGSSQAITATASLNKQAFAYVYTNSSESGNAFSKYGLQYWQY